MPLFGKSHRAARSSEEMLFPFSMMMSVENEGMAFGGAKGSWDLGDRLVRMVANAERGALHGGGEGRGVCDRKCQEVAERTAILRVRFLLGKVEARGVEPLS